MNSVFEEVRINLPHIELAALVAGPENGRPVIALHGWLDNANSFARLLPKLEGVRVVALDLAGHGYSAHRPVGAHYSLWDYCYDVLQVAEKLGWERFSLLGHSMGAIASVMLAGAAPERVERLVLIDGLLPMTSEAEDAPQRLGTALKAMVALVDKRKAVHASIDQALAARMRGVAAVTREAAELLARRGLMAVPGGYTWRSDNRLTLPSPLRLTQAHAEAFIAQVACPVQLVVAGEGILKSHAAYIAGLPFQTVQLPGGHHLHLDDEAGAEAVAACINRFLAAP